MVITVSYSNFLKDSLDIWNLMLFSGVLTRKQLSSWTNNISVRGFKCCEILNKTKSTNSDIDDKLNLKKKKDSKTSATGQPVLNIIAPEIKETDETENPNNKTVNQNSDISSNVIPIASKQSEYKGKDGEEKIQGGIIFYLNFILGVFYFQLF